MRAAKDVAYTTIKNRQSLTLRTSLYRLDLAFSVIIISAELALILNSTRNGSTSLESRVSKRGKEKKRKAGKNEVSVAAIRIS